MRIEALEKEIVKLKLSSLFGECFAERNGIPQFKLFIGGKWTESKDRGTLEIDTPIDDSVIAKVQAATADDVDDAVAAAYRARKSIRDIPPSTALTSSTGRGTSSRTTGRTS
jgi:hypothetical protein